MSCEGLNSTLPPSPIKTILPHLRVARMAVARASALAEQSGAFHAVAASQFHSATLSGPEEQRLVAESKVSAKAGLRQDIDADNLVARRVCGKGARRKAHRTKASDQHRVVAADADLVQTFVYGPEAAGHLCAIGIGESSGSWIRSFSSAII